MFISNNQQNATDNSGYTALHYAARSGHYEICQLLLAAGSDVNAKTKSGQVTPLMRAATIGKCINNTKSENKTHFSLTNSNCIFTLGHDKIVKLLLCHNADIKVCDNDGNTALHRAIQSGHTTIAQMLKVHEPQNSLKNH